MVVREVNTTRSALNRESITDAAIAIAEREGVNRLTMRAVASNLDCGTMSLYTHVENRDDLESAIVDRLISELDVPSIIDSAGDRWDHLLEQLMLAYFEVAVAHPQTFELLALAPAENSEVNAHLDSIAEHLIELGHSPYEARAAIEACDAFATGYLLMRTRPVRADSTAALDESVTTEALAGYEDGMRILFAGLAAELGSVA